YVTKPINPLELIARIKVHLNNARTTLSAQTALDSAGQNLCAVSRRGELRWATPQVNHYLERLCPGGWRQLQLAEPLSHWLKHNPPEGGQLQMAAGGATLKWILVGTTGDDEYLLRLVNEDENDGCEQLKQRFAIT